MFNALKYALIRASLLSPLDYQCDLLYLTIASTTVAMVQKDDVGTEHPMCRNHNDTKVTDTHVEKLALVVVQVVHIFRHYILLHKIMVVSDYNPLAYILSLKLLGGKYSKWILIL